MARGSVFLSLSPANARGPTTPGDGKSGYTYASPEDGMKRLFRSAFMFAALLLPLPVLAKDKADQFKFTFAGRERTCYYFAPAASQGALPLIVLLHGSGRDGRVKVDHWKALAASERLIVVAPNAYDAQTWRSDDDGPDFLRSVVEQIKANHAVDTDRIYLFGHSAGAVYGLAIALIQSDYFAAAAVHAGTFDPANSELFAHATRKIPIAIWVGSDDQSFPVAAE